MEEVLYNKVEKRAEQIFFKKSMRGAAGTIISLVMAVCEEIEALDAKTHRRLLALQKRMRKVEDKLDIRR